MAGVAHEIQTPVSSVRKFAAISAELCTELRQETAQIIFNTQKGLRLEKEALRVIEGKQCVYVKFANQVFLRPVKVLLEDENHVLLSAEEEEGVNEVEMYDVVVVEAGGVELYDKKIL